MEKPILRQIANTRADAKFYLILKFYIPNPVDLEEEYTRFGMHFRKLWERDLDVGPTRAVLRFVRRKALVFALRSRLNDSISCGIRLSAGGGGVIAFIPLSSLHSLWLSLPLLIFLVRSPYYILPGPPLHFFPSFSFFLL